MFWTKEQNFAEPFWGTEYEKQEYISRVNRRKTRLEGLVLYQNEPNPFSTETKIAVHIPSEVIKIQLEIYTKSGKQVKTQSIYDRGDVIVRLNADELEPGEYVYNLGFSTLHEAERKQGYKTMIVEKKK